MKKLDTREKCNEFVANNKDIIGKCPVFVGIDQREAQHILMCLNARTASYNKGDVVFRAGERPRDIGVVIRGGVHIERIDFWGNRTLHAVLRSADIFGEAFACSEEETFPISVIARETTEVLLLNYRKIINFCTPSCSYHLTMIQNMMRILAKKNVFMTEKINHLTQRSTRTKVLSYLSEQAVLEKSSRFAIPLNRQELAEYLAVDRSALSKTLSSMQDEGIIDFSKNHFRLIER